MITSAKPRISDFPEHDRSPPSRARLRPPRRARDARSPSDACRPRARSPLHIRRVRVSLSPPSLARFRGGPRRRRVPRENRTTVARARSRRRVVDVDDRSTRTRARGRGKISRPRRVARRVHRAVASASSSARIDRETARRPTVQRFFGMQSFVARTRAGASHARRRGREIRSEAERRRRSTSRARRWKRGARARRRFRARGTSASRGE